MQKELIDYQKPTIENLFTRKKYKIPKYQRPFSWNIDNAEKFWDDIFNENDDYFMGSIVLNKKDDYYEVIDGQQRITTISLFFISLFLYYKKNVNKDDAVKYISNYLIYGDLNGEHQILSLSRSNEDFYNKLVRVSSVDELKKMYPESKSNTNILSIVSYFIDKLSENEMNDVNLEKKRLSAILDRIRNKVFFIEIDVNDYKQASKLFEVLNNRGVDLTKAD